jgi:hypothetical protein
MCVFFFLITCKIANKFLKLFISILSILLKEYMHFTYSNDTLFLPTELEKVELEENYIPFEKKIHQIKLPNRRNKYNAID